ncbi:Hydrogenase assembly protein HupF (plasmid) [Cupriavidus necator]|uniref:HypC/HybG/HupF family hydrogenase formation chaperone n=1 Tax=Cupriavidus necator TaxID=106590 RepID=UPI003F735BCD
MCLAIPTRVVEVRPGQQAIIELGGVRKEVSTALLDAVDVDDYVIVHVGYAIGKIDPDEARRTLEIFSELAQAATQVQPLGEAGQS